MIWRRLKKATPEQEKEFEERMSSEEVTWKDKIAMVLSAYVAILLPCILVLGVIALLIIGILLLLSGA